jgi:hypothetical protein
MKLPRNVVVVSIAVAVAFLILGALTQAKRTPDVLSTGVKPPSARAGQPAARRGEPRLPLKRTREGGPARVVDPGGDARRASDEASNDLVRDATAEDSAVAEIAYYRHHVLLDEHGKASYRAFLSDPAMLEKVKDDLLFPEEVRETLVGNTKRLIEIDYLHDALAWSENPNREEIVDTIADVILADNFRDELGMDMRISLAGNKRELYALLHEFARDRTASLVDEARGSRVQSLVEYLAEDVPARAKRVAEFERKL